MTQKKHFAPLATTLAVAACFATFGSATILQDSDVEVPNTFQSNTPALASQVNENFSALALAIGDAKDGVAANADLLSALPRPTTTIEVAPEGGDFQSVAAALDSITNASASSPVLVLVYPGLFEETELMLVKAFVHLKGFGPEVTVVRSDRASAVANGESAAIQIEENGALSDLTVENIGDSDVAAVAIHIQNADNSVRIRNVQASAPGGTGTLAVAMNLLDASPSVEDSQFDGDSQGVLASSGVNGSLEPEFFRCTFDGGTGLLLFNTSATLVSCEIHGSNLGLGTFSGDTTTIEGSRVSTDDGNASFQVGAGSELFAATTGFDGGNAVGNGSDFKFVHCYKAEFDPIVNGFGSTIE